MESCAVGIAARRFSIGYQNTGKLDSNTGIVYIDGWRLAIMKRGQLVADAVAVLCPYCGEPQPNKEDGSEQWEAEHFRKLQGSWKCVSCDSRFLVTGDTKVMFR